GWLAERVKDGEVRWVLASDQGTSPADGRVGSSELMTAVTQACEPVQLESSGTDSTTTGASAGQQSGTASASSNGTDSTTDSNVIYDCAGKASALAAQ
ncbi:MAG TPA: hypothetical protein P5138_09710, partial [Solirubrobacterales bacterium]|nr:hypothetical protein [Solirubrobacterales bacterium]